MATQMKRGLEITEDEGFNTWGPMWRTDGLDGIDPREFVRILSTGSWTMEVSTPPKETHNDRSRTDRR